MTDTIYVDKWRRDESIRAIVEATFPDYRRTKVCIQPSESVTLHDLNWSGGTRSEYRACTLSGEPLGSSEKYSALAPWSNPAEGAELPVPPGAVVARGGHFCGRPSMLTIHVHPSDMPRYLR